MDNFGLLFAKSLGGGGGSGTDNYNELSNKPQINSVTLSGNKSLANLGIQAELTFDDEPTEDSTNPVTSGAVYTALATKQDTLTVDSAPTENSTNPVQSGGVYTALAGKEDTLTFDNAPTNNSNNPVKSGGIYTALGQKQDTLTFDGTYSASTNAAATVSTVTNAIGALDVTGESGISASKTISAWSEADGKVSVSTQDIAIAGTQAVLTGYTPESPAQTDSILATDTVNAAIKKLDERSRVDENNISLHSEQINNTKRTYTITTDMTPDEFGYITANGTVKRNTSAHRIYVIELGSISDIYITQNNKLGTTLAYGRLTDNNGNLKQVFAAENTTNVHIHIFNGEATDLLYIVQYELSNTSYYYNKWETANYKSITDSYYNEIVDIINENNNYNDCLSKPYSFNQSKVQFFGDSIIYGYINTNTRANPTIPDSFAAKTNATVINSGVSGSTFTALDGYTNILTTIQNRLDSTADYIIIAGGVNDWQLGVGEAELKTAVNNVCTYLSSNYTGVVIFVTPINNGGWSTISEPSQSLDSVRKIITEVAISNGYDVLQGYKIPFPTKYDNAEYISLMYADKLHPSQLGYDTYSKALISALL